VRFLVPRPGPLLEVLGLDEAEAVEGVVFATVYRRPGDVLTPLRRGADRAGAVLAVGASRDDALARAARAAELIELRVAEAEALV
jgi:hypothetical protein